MSLFCSIFIWFLLFCTIGPNGLNMVRAALYYHLKTTSFGGGNVQLAMPENIKFVT